VTFEWDDEKNLANQRKHGVSFEEAQLAFTDPSLALQRDSKHSTRSEERFYCCGKVEGEVITVRFTLRVEAIRIIGAGYWRKGAKLYENR
jgi:uncharacterized protein